MLEPNYDFIAKELFESYRKSFQDFRFSKWDLQSKREQAAWTKVAERSYELWKSIFATNQEKALKDAFKRQEP
jgi:hypothetical protein